MSKLGKRIAGLVLAAAISTTVFMGTGISAFAYTQTTGTVTSDNVKVRESASTTAKQVSSLKNGDKIDIVDEATDASGYVWYKIYVNKSEFGYVRSDLVNKAGGNSSSKTTNTSTTSTASLPETSVTAVEQKSAQITTDSANVRKGAGTGYDSVGKVTKGDTVTITGEATAADGKTWYQVTFGANSKTGFIRSDLLQVTEAAPAEGGEAVEGGENPDAENAENTEGGEDQSQASTTVTSEQGDGTYSLVYTTDEEGTGIWYLYDNVGGYRVKVKDLIEAAQSADQVNKLRKSVKTYKTIVGILAVLAAILLGGVVFLVLKLRDSLYYEDEEEEEYDRYSASAKKRPTEDAELRRPRNADERPARRPAEEERPARRPAEERTVRPNRRNEDEYERPTRRPERAQEAPRPARDTADSQEERPTRRPMRAADEDRPSRRPVESRREEQPVREPAPKRKARNFLGEDDDFEFEFLDLDD